MSRMTLEDLANRVHYFHFGPPPTHWRWILATEVVNTPISLAGIEEVAGAWVCKAADHLRSGSATYPEIEAARQIYETDNALRDELDARILVRQTDAEIATRMDLSQAVVEAYEGIFYAVRSNLSADSWIRIWAIRWTEPGRPLRVGTLLRYIGHLGDLLLLENAIQVARRYAAAVQTKTLDALRRDDRDVNSFARMIDVHSMEVTQENVMDLFRCHIRLIALDQWRAANPTGDATEVQEQLDEAIAALPKDAPPDCRQWATAAA